jgi:hypothetical protein
LASEVDICNLSLSHIGDSAIVQAINPPDGSTQAEKCQRFYPIARDNVLESYNWRFSMRRATSLAPVANVTGSWIYAFALPNDCLEPVAVLLPSETDDNNTQDYTVETASDGSFILYTNVQFPVLRYKVKVTDTTKFTPLCVSAISWLLSAYLAGPILKGKTGLQVAQMCMSTYKDEMGKASSSDAQTSQTSGRQTVQSAWIKARGGTFNPPDLIKR